MKILLNIFALSIILTSCSKDEFEGDCNCVTRTSKYQDGKITFSQNIHKDIYQSFEQGSYPEVGGDNKKAIVKKPEGSSEVVFSMDFKGSLVFQKEINDPVDYIVLDLGIVSKDAAMDFRQIAMDGAQATVRSELVIVHDGKDQEILKFTDRERIIKMSPSHYNGKYEYHLRLDTYVDFNSGEEIEVFPRKININRFVITAYQDMENPERYSSYTHKGDCSENRVEYLVDGMFQKTFCTEK
ncbi:hypothetical protein ACFSTE_13245 [Aquimarina hainanensis]|uniref:Uncharacterized protein n=1 Tax=Aquimarina hainanensis TaxID=1578017 RepID=A0ABW5NAD5_9FLAO